MTRICYPGLIAMLLFSPSQASAAPATDCATYAVQLRTMAEIDQALRHRWDHAAVPPHARNASELPKIVQQTMLADAEHTRRLKRLVTDCGWPQRGVHGAQVVDDAWLLAQHADPDPLLRKAVIAGMEAAIQAGQGSQVQLAYYVDRGLLSDNKPQLYGTQLKAVGACKYEFEPYDDRRKVDERRKAIGLGTLEAYLAQVVASFAAAGCSAK